MHGFWRGGDGRVSIPPSGPSCPCTMGLGAEISSALAQAGLLQLAHTSRHLQCVGTACRCLPVRLSEHGASLLTAGRNSTFSTGWSLIIRSSVIFGRIFHSSPIVSPVINQSFGCAAAPQRYANVLH